MHSTASMVGGRLARSPLTVLILIVCLGYVALPAVADPPPPELIGRWETDETMPSGLGAVLWFRDDGTCASGILLILRGTWRMEDGYAITTVAQEDSPLRIRYENGKAVAATSKAGSREVVLERHGAPETDPPSLVGVWVSRTLRGTVYQRFGADGRYDVRMPVGPAVLNTIRVEGDKLLGYKRNGEPVRFAVEGSRLTLHDGRGKPQGHTRVEPADWYPLEVKAAPPRPEPPPKEGVRLRIERNGRVSVHASVAGKDYASDDATLQIEGKEGEARAKALQAFGAWLEAKLATATTKRDAHGYIGIPLVVEVQSGLTRAQVVPYLERATRRSPGLYKLDLVRLAGKRIPPPPLRVAVGRRLGLEEPPSYPGDVLWVRLHFEPVPGAVDTYGIRLRRSPSVPLPRGWRGTVGESAARVAAYRDALTKVMKTVKLMHVAHGSGQDSLIVFGGRDEDPEDPAAQPEPWLFEVVLDLIASAPLSGISTFDIDRFLPKLALRPRELPR